MPFDRRCACVAKWHRTAGQGGGNEAAHEQRAHSHSAESATTGSSLAALRAGSSPDKQLVESLGKISAEIDSVTRQLAEGSLDDLAIRTRYLDYKYGDAIEAPPKEH